MLFFITLYPHLNLPPSFFSFFSSLLVLLPISLTLPHAFSPSFSSLFLYLISSLSSSLIFLLLYSLSFPPQSSLFLLPFPCSFSAFFSSFLFLDLFRHLFLLPIPLFLFFISFSLLSPSSLI